VENSIQTCNKPKRSGVALIADAKQGKGSRQSTFGAGGCQEYHRQAGQGTCHSRATATQFESDAVNVMQSSSVEPSTGTRRSDFLHNSMEEAVTSLVHFI
jgi:hypothetical protein